MTTSNLIIYNLLLSKYTLKQINFPKIQSLFFNIILYYKQKNKFFIFISIIMLFIFFTPNFKTRFLFKISQINILQINLRNEKTIFKFIYNFIYLYFPLIDSFVTEFKYLQKKNLIKFSFFKFPLIFELNTFFHLIENLLSFLNIFKFQLKFQLKKKKNILINCNFLQMLKIPLKI